MGRGDFVWGWDCRLVFGVEDVGGEGVECAGEEAVADGEGGAVDAVGVGSFGQGGVEAYALTLAGEVDECCAAFAAGYLNDGTVFVREQVLDLSVHGFAEVDGGYGLRVLEFIIAACADAVVAPVVLAGAAGGTAEEQRASVLACGEEHEACAHLVVGHAGRLVLVAVGVVALDPCDELRGTGGVVPVGEVGAVVAALAESLAQGVAVVAGDEVHVLGVLGFLDVAVLKHLAVDVEAVGHEQG